MVIRKKRTTLEKKEYIKRYIMLFFQSDRELTKAKLVNRLQAKGLSLNKINILLTELKNEGKLEED